MDQQEIHDLYAQIQRLEAKVRAYENQPDGIGDLRRVLLQMRMQMLQQAELLERLSNSPRQLGLVLATRRFKHNLTVGTMVRLLSNRGDIPSGTIGLVERPLDSDGDVYLSFDEYDSTYVRASRLEAVNRPRGLVTLLVNSQTVEAGMPDFELETGDCVAILEDGMQIVEKVELTNLGEVAVVAEVVSDTQIMITRHDSTRLVLTNENLDLQQGDRVVLDSTGTVVIQVLESNGGKTFKVAAVPNISWDHIAGHTQPKATLIEAMGDAYEHASLFRYYGKTSIKGLLLYGPPGCGKTLLVQAAFNQMAAWHGQEAVDTGLIYIKGPEILSMFVGVAEERVRDLFARARRHKEENGYPAIIFIDEADAILGRRGSGVSSDMERTIVPQFIAEMQGLEDSGALVILATNRPDTLDEAVIRDGRIDRKIYIGRPDYQATRETAALYLRNTPLHNGYTIHQLAELIAQEVFSDNYPLLEVLHPNGTAQPFTLSGILNGAMVKGIVDRATSAAMQRDKAARTRTGITPQDLINAVAAVYRENLALDHTQALQEHEELLASAVGIRKVAVSAHK